MCGSCHFDSPSNDELSVECCFDFFSQHQSDLKVAQITKNYIFSVIAPLLNLECAQNLDAVKKKQ